MQLKHKWTLIRFFIPVIALGMSNTFAMTIIKHATIIDGTNRAPIQNATMVVSDGKIVKIAKDNAMNIPPYAKVIDATGKYIMPALIDTHIHLGLSKGNTVDDINNTRENVLRQLRLFAQFGVGAVLSLGRDQPFIYELRKKRNQQSLPQVYPYIFTAGQGIGVTGGAPPALQKGSDPVYRPHSVSEALSDLTKVAQNHPDIIKIWVDDWLGKMPKMQPELYKAIISKAHQLGLRVAAHVYYLEDARALVAAKADILEHDIRDFPVDNTLLEAMKNQGVVYVPTLVLTESFYNFSDHPEWLRSPFFTKAIDASVLHAVSPDQFKPDNSQRAVLAISLKNAKLAYDHGIPLGFGTDAGARSTRIQGFSEHRELELLVAAGLTPLQAIQSATAVSAKLLHAEDKMGTLRAGMLANFIILNANPLEKISNTQQINAVYIDGKLVK